MAYFYNILNRQNKVIVKKRQKTIEYKELTRMVHTYLWNDGNILYLG